MTTRDMQRTAVGVFADRTKAQHAIAELKRMGFKSLTTNAVQGEGALERAYDKFLAAYPVGKDEHCDSAVCHRISFLYSLLYRHEQLNAMTHQYMHELFGEATITAFEGLAVMVNKSRVWMRRATTSTCRT